MYQRKRRSRVFKRESKISIGVLILLIGAFTTVVGGVGGLVSATWAFDDRMDKRVEKTIAPIHTDISAIKKSVMYVREDMKEVRAMLFKLTK